MSAVFCELCGSLLRGTDCTHVGCKNSTLKKRKPNPKSAGYVRNKKTGALVDKETGQPFVTAASMGRKHWDI